MIYDFNKFFENKLQSPQRLTNVIGKKFFKELKEHIIYWFNNELNYDFIDITLDKNGVTFWFSHNENITYKISYINDDLFSTTENLKECKMIIKAYSYTEPSNLLKETELIIKLDNLNSKFLKNIINQLNKRIVKNPKNDIEKDDFNKSQTRYLGDNFY